MKIIKRYPSSTARSRKPENLAGVPRVLQDPVNKICKQCGFRIFQEVGSCPSCSFDNGDGSGLTTDIDGIYITHEFK